jgi:hypothetical protein
MKKIQLMLGFFTLISLGVCFGATSCSGTITCDGEYRAHLQGVATDGVDIFWSFTDKIIRTDLKGKILASQSAPSHQGDLCCKDGVVYVAVNRGRFNQENEAVSEVAAYDGKTLKPLKTWSLDMPHGAGGMTWRGDRFFVVGGLPATHERNYVYEYTSDFKLVRRHELETGFTLMGIQTAAFENGSFYFGIYGGKGNPSGVLKVSPDFSVFERFTGDGSVGILKLGAQIFTGKAFRDAKTKAQRGLIRRDDGFCSASKRYVPTRKGGTLRIFFAGRDKGMWEDCAYELRPDGYRPLTQYHKAFLPVESGGGRKATPAVCVGAGRSYSISDLVRGVRRAAEQNEMLAICLPGRPETLYADKGLSTALSAVEQEAKSLGVKVIK